MIESHWLLIENIWTQVDLIVPEHLVWQGPQRGWEPVERPERP